MTAEVQVSGSELERSILNLSVIKLNEEVLEVQGESGLLREREAQGDCQPP